MKPEELIAILGIIVASGILMGIGVVIFFELKRANEELEKALQDDINRLETVSNKIKDKLDMKNKNKLFGKMNYQEKEWHNIIKSFHKWAAMTESARSEFLGEFSKFHEMEIQKQD